MVFSWHSSNGFELLLKGKTAQGTILSYKEKSLTTKNGSPRSTFMPIVKFEVNGKSYQFNNYMGSNSTGGINTTVPVIYSASNPEFAMIDQGWRNFIPWAPIFIMGLLIVMGAIDKKNGVKIVPRGPATVEEAHRLAGEGRMIDAIKIYRKATGKGLKEAKDYIDEFLKNTK